MNPALGALLVGATCIALSPIFVRLSEAGPTATAFWRVALAVPALWILYFLQARTSKPALLRQMAATARRRVRFRRRPRLLARLDQAHLGGELHAARQPGVDLRHAGGVDLPAAEADAPVPRRPRRRAARRAAAGAHQPRVLVHRPRRRRARRGDGDVLRRLHPRGEGAARPRRDHAAPDGGHQHDHRAVPASGGARLRRSRCCRRRRSAGGC